MRLHDEDIREFSELWKQEVKETLSPEEARHRASQLLELYLRLAEPLPNESVERSDDVRKKT